MLGLIARADNRGLGQQTWAVHRNLAPAKTMVVDCPSMDPLPLRLERFPDAQIVHGLPSFDDFARFCEGLSAVYTAETGYGPHLWDVANRLGVKTLLHVNYEFWDINDRPTVLALPSLWNANRFPDTAVHLPVPIETDRLTIEDHPDTAKHFLHVVGRPAVNDRNGTADLLQALRHVTAPITLTITCQSPTFVANLISEHNITIPSNVALNIECGDVEHYWDIYHHIDAMILPRRFGGLCLPAQEAIGAGIPVIMPNIDPNNTWLPQAWLTPAELLGDFWAKQHVFYYRTQAKALADKIQQLATDEDFYGHSLWKAQELRNALSWDTLKPRYLELL